MKTTILTLICMLAMLTACDKNRQGPDNAQAPAEPAKPVAAENPAKPVDPNPPDSPAKDVDGGNLPIVDDGRFEVEPIVEANNRFATQLYTQLKSNDGNLFFSPYSISAAMGMTYLGAKGNTAKEIRETMGYPMGNVNDFARMFGTLQQKLQADPDKDGYKLNIANALWTHQDYKFLNNFLELAKNRFDAEVRALNFTQPEPARQTINTWVEDQTNKKIKDLLPSDAITPRTRLILTNAIYFKGAWKAEFDKKRTRDGRFYTSTQNHVKTPMMHRTGDYSYAELPDYQLLAMPYKGDSVSMLVILPKARDGLSKIEPKLADAMAASDRLMLKKVEVAFPKFKIEGATIPLADQLMKMGMKEPFTMKADFSGMDGTRKLFIQKVLHKAFVEVNEEGTEAAAATSVIVGVKSAMPRHPRFIADHPFIFMIIDNETGAILFLGRVANPKS